MPVPPFIANRLATAAPPNCDVVADSIPVVSFGDPEVARVATIGINPSRAEFLVRGRLRMGRQERIPSLTSLGVTSLVGASSTIIEAAYQGCCDYFRLNYYKGWFNKFNEVLAKAGASYHDRSACHLDLVQVATDPVWGKLNTIQQMTLLTADKGFLSQLINNGKFELLLLNGRTCMDVVGTALPVTWSACWKFKHLTRQYEVKEGMYGHRRVIGWSLNLQSTPGVTPSTRNSLAAFI